MLELKGRPYDIFSRNIFPFSMEDVALYVPAWQEDTQNSPFPSYDPYHHICTVSGAVYNLNEGRDYDKIDDYISIPTHTSLDNPFDGGGTHIVWFKTAGVGEGGVGMFYAKTNIPIQVSDASEAGGKTKARFVCLFSGVNGVWESTDTQFTNDQWSFYALSYNADSSGNDPTFYVASAGSTLTTLTVGSGITQTGTTSGTRTSGAGETNYIGSTNGANTIDGIIAETIVVRRILTVAEVTEYYLRSKERFS